MIINALKERLTKQPFEPFVIRGSSGESYPVPAPYFVALLKSDVFIAEANSDHWVQLPYLHVAGIESARRNGNGHHGGKSGGRKRK